MVAFGLAVVDNPRAVNQRIDIGGPASCTWLYIVKNASRIMGVELPQWRGKVQSLPGGEAYYFRDWPGLVRHVETMLSSESEPFPGSDIPNGGES